MRPFWVVDLSAAGDVHARQPYEYATLERVPGCIDLIAEFSNRLYRDPEGFDTPVPHTARRVAARWRAAADTAGVLTLRNADALVSLSVLAAGIDPAADALTLRAFGEHLVRELHDTGVEPSLAVLDLAERPLLATLNVSAPAEDSIKLVAALADRCFAASYFRYQRLV